MTIYEIVKKLTGDISPVGDTCIDEKRFNNLKDVTELVSCLINDIQLVSKRINSYEFSVKRSADFAKDFLSNDLGIND